MAEDSLDVDIVQAALRAADSGDLDGCRQYMHPDLVVTVAGGPTRIEGRENWLGGVAAMAAAFPDLQTTINDIISAGDRVAVRSTITGTHQGWFQGIGATGRRIEVMSNDFYRMADGLVVEGWIVTDTAALYAQIS